MLPFTSLDAATVTGAGSARDLETSLRYHTMQVVITGSPSTIDLGIEGSMDGTTWVMLTSTQSTQATGLVTSNNHVVRHVRSNLYALTGGSSPTVTVKIAST